MAMQRVFACALTVGLVASVCRGGDPQLELARTAPLVRDKAAAAKLGWELGVQTWTFGGYVLPEILLQAKALDVDYIEIGPTITFDRGGKRLNTYSLSVAQQQRLRDLLKTYGLQIRQLYAHCPRNEQEWQAVMEFAKAFGADTIVSEPRPEHFDMLQRLCLRYHVRIAIHNHPPKSDRYQLPKKVLAQISGRGKMFGFCPDIGHWVRAGVSPLDQVRRTEVAQRLITFHYNDVAKRGEQRSPHVVVGTGAAQMGEVLEQLAQIGFRGRFTLEYGKWKKNFNDLKASIRFFDAAARKQTMRDGK